MNNKGSQPIYDNKSLKDAGKYDFENVNAINKRNGEMIFDSTITYKEKEKKNINPILITSIVSGILIILVCVFAFTDLKYNSDVLLKINKITLKYETVLSNV